MAVEQKKWADATPNCMADATPKIYTAKVHMESCPKRVHHQGCPVFAASLFQNKSMTLLPGDNESKRHPIGGIMRVQKLNGRALELPVSLPIDINTSQ